MCAGRGSNVRRGGLCAQDGEASCTWFRPVPFTKREGMGVVEELDVVLHAADSVKGL